MASKGILLRSVIIFCLWKKSANWRKLAHGQSDVDLLENISVTFEVSTTLLHQQGNSSEKRETESVTELHDKTAKQVPVYIVKDVEKTLIISTEM